MRGIVSTVGAAALAIVSACGGGDMDQTTPAPAAEPPAAAPAAAESSQEMTMNLPQGVTPEMVAEGNSIFHGVGNCRSCHGEDAKGVGMLAPDLTDDAWLQLTGRNFDEIVKLVTTGVAQPKEAAAPMPAMGGASLTEEQVRAVAAYVYSLGH